MKMLAICKIDQLGGATTEQSTRSRRRKMENLKLQTAFSFKYIVSDNSVSKEEVEDLSNKRNPTVLLPKLEPMVSPKSFSEPEIAAVKLQKVYRSFRTRRILADCAIVCEELWWKASEFADKSESAISKWARARAMAVKVGKGLSTDDRTQRLALRHWLEAIDPRHRYGHNLNFYYDVWFWSKSAQPFFYWLDVGDGKKVNLDVCPRKDLQRQCIKYLGPKEREAYEVIVEGGKLVYTQSKELVHTTEGSKWIFVLSSSKVLYVGQKKKGQFQHSSFLAGAATISSGRLVTHNGVLDAIWPYSGHYRPTAKNFMEFICFLEENNVDLTNVKKYPVDDDVPLCKPVKEHIEGNVGSSDSATANSNGHIGSNLEGSLRESMPLPSKWTTGVGPRIGCMREYPTRLQVQALEELNLSPGVNHATFASKAPIPSPRPSIKVHLSPRLVSMGLPSPRPHAGGLKAEPIPSRSRKVLQRIESQINRKTENLKKGPKNNIYII